jgi:hypothetical protein
MSFPVKLFTIKGNLVFMNNLYHKVAVASVCTALGFVWEQTKKLKQLHYLDTYYSIWSQHKVQSFELPSSELSSQSDRSCISGSVGWFTTRLAEFNISSFFLAPNTIIKSAVFQDKISSYRGPFRPISLSIFGYVGNGTAEVSDA